jgi:predicted KAP-like P-loop ATPase
LVLAFVGCELRGVRKVLCGVKVSGGIIASRLKGKVRLIERVEGLTDLLFWVRGILGGILGGVLGYVVTSIFKLSGFARSIVAVIVLLVTALLAVYRPRFFIRLICLLVFCMGVSLIFLSMNEGLVQSLEWEPGLLGAGVSVVALAIAFYGLVVQREGRAELGKANNSKGGSNTKEEAMENNDANSEAGLSVDEPISKPEQDKLNRNKFAEHLADVLFEHKDSKCVIVAINGEWGCGKSSILNLVEGDLVKKRKVGEDVVIVRFNPWYASDVEQLMVMFFRELKASLLGLDGREKAREYISKLLDIFVLCLKVAEWSPIGNPLVKMGLAVTGEVRQMLKDADGKTVEEIKKELNQKLKDYAKRIFVIIDDIDRLDVEAMKLLFRLIRVNADFENTTYLLAFDRNLVEHLLEGEQPGHGREYVDKIVQVPINVPSPDEALMTSILHHEVNAFIKEWDREGFDERGRHWQELYAQGGFRRYFNSIRDIVRYANGLRITYPLVSGEINMVDFMGLNLIRTFAPLSYERVRKNKELLTEGPPTLTGRGEESYKLAEETLEGIYNFPSSLEGGEEKGKERQKELAGLVKSTCRVLFPKVYGDEREAEWRREKRVCSGEYFDKYFMLGVPVGEISDWEMRLFIMMAKDSNAFRDRLLEFFHKGMGRRLLERMQDYIGGVDKESVESVIVSIFNAEDRIVEEQRLMLMVDSYVLACRIVYLLLSEVIKERDRRKQIIIDAIEECEPVFLPVEFVSLIDGREEGGTGRKILLELSAADLEEIRRKCLDKIKMFVRGKKLSKAPMLSAILYRWKEWDNSEVVKSYVDELVSTDEGLWDFLGGSVRTVLSSEGDYKIIPKKSVNEFSDFDYVDRKVQEIVGKQGKELTEKQKAIVGALERGKKDDLDWE